LEIQRLRLLHDILGKQFRQNQAESQPFCLHTLLNALKNETVLKHYGSAANFYSNRAHATPDTEPSGQRSMNMHYFSPPSGPPLKIRAAQSAIAGNQVGDTSIKGCLRTADVFLMRRCGGTIERFIMG
jgi:hypothetical protein